VNESAMAPDNAEDWPDHVPVRILDSRNETSPSIAKISAAMAKAQGAMGGALKDSANPFFKSKYADLESVWGACRKQLAENEIAVFQLPSASGNKVAITTLLGHASGEWIRNTLTVESKDASPQGVGSAITYTRRYGLSAMVGVYQTDDDAEAAQGRSQRGPSQDETRALAARFKAAFDADIDGPMLEIHEEANKNQELYEVAWHLLASNVRARLKLGIDRAKAAREGKTYTPPQPRGAARQ